MSASIAIQVLPKAENDTELVRIVDEVIAYIKSCGLRCEVGPFETTIEGDSYDQLMDIVKAVSYTHLDVYKRQLYTVCMNWLSISTIYSSPACP